MKNILFINYGGIGDEILFLPCIQGVKALFPEAKITLCLEPRAKGIKGLSPLIDEVLTVDIKAGGIKKYFNILKFIISVWFMGFDTVISSGKSPFVAIILFLTGIKTKIGYKTATSRLLTREVPLNENCYAGLMYFDLVKPLGGVEFELPVISYEKNLKLPFEDEFILIHPGVSKMSVSKNIIKSPKAAFWVDLTGMLLNKNKKVVLAGGPDDGDIIAEITEKHKGRENFYFVKTKNLLELAGLIKKSNTLICCDSAPMHIGVALNANIIALFAPTNEKKLLPEKENIKIITKNLDCRPCLWDKRLENCEKSACIDFCAEDVINRMK